MGNSKIEEGCMAITLPNFKRKEKFRYLDAGKIVIVGKFLGSHTFVHEGEAYGTNQKDIWEINIPLHTILDDDTIGPDMCLASESGLRRLDHHPELEIQTQETIKETT